MLKVKEVEEIEHNKTFLLTLVDEEIETKTLKAIFKFDEKEGWYLIGNSCAKYYECELKELLIIVQKLNTKEK